MKRPNAVKYRAEVFVFLKKRYPLFLLFHLFEEEKNQRWINKRKLKRKIVIDCLPFLTKKGRRKNQINGGLYTEVVKLDKASRK